MPRSLLTKDTTRLFFFPELLALKRIVVDPIIGGVGDAKGDVRVVGNDGGFGVVDVNSETFIRRHVLWCTVVVAHWTRYAIVGGAYGLRWL